MRALPVMYWGSGGPAPHGWTTRNSPGANNTLVAVAWGPLFVALAGGSNRILTVYSTDGVTWTEGVNCASAQWADLAWNGTLFAEVGNGIAGTSPDGITWTQRSISNRPWVSISSNGAGFAVVRSSGGVGGSFSAFSVNGVTWQDSDTPIASLDWGGICWASSLGLYVAVAGSGTGNRVATSPDGGQWTSRTSAADITWVDVAWNGSVLTAVAISGGGASKVMTSPDGIVWTSRTAVDRAWRGITFGANVFVAVADDAGATLGMVMTSPDGIVWTSRTAASSSKWADVARNEFIFVAVSSTESSTNIMTSTTGF